MEPFFLRDETVRIEHSSVMLEYDVETDPWANENVRFLFTNENLFMNRCTECGLDMGPHNPRQLCGKWDCEEEYEPPVLGDQAALLVGRLRELPIAKGCARLVDIAFRPDTISGLDKKAPSMLFLCCQQGYSHLTTTDVNVCVTTALILNRICGNYPVALEQILLYASEEWQPMFRTRFYKPYETGRGNCTLLGPPRLLHSKKNLPDDRIYLPSGRWDGVDELWRNSGAIVAFTEPGANWKQCDLCAGHIDSAFVISQPCSPDQPPPRPLCANVPGCRRSDEPRFHSCAMLHLRLQEFHGELRVAVGGSQYMRDTVYGSQELPVRLFVNVFTNDMFRFPTFLHWIVSRYYAIVVSSNNGSVKRVRVEKNVPVNIQIHILSFLEPEPWMLSFDRRSYWPEAPETELVHYGRAYYLEDHCQRFD